VTAPDAGARRERAWRIAGVALLAALAALALATFRGYGTTWDEEVHFLYGEQILSWYRSGFADASATEFGDLYLYGGLFDTLAQLLVRALPFGLYETRHLANAAVGWLGIAATWRLGSRVGGARVGLAAAALLALTPAWWGHSFANPKDVPFAAFAALALDLVIRAARRMPRPGAWPVVAAGLALGAALGVRPGGMFLLGLAALAFGTEAALAGGQGPGARPAGVAPGLARAAGALLGACAVAWATMLACWPWAQGSPLLRPLQAAAAAARFRWIGEVLFDGRLVWSNDLPRSYLPTWFAITLPDGLILALAAAAVLAAVRLARRRAAGRAAREAAFLALAGLGPVAAAAALRPVMYDAQRQFLFVLPPLCVLAAWGLDRLLREAALPRWARALAGGAVAALSLVTFRDMVALHPYQTVYFNRLSGGLPAAAGRYETDYWGATHREGLEEVLRRYRPAPPLPVTVANCSVRHLTAYWLSRHPEAAGLFVNVGAEEDPDLLLATTRFGCHEGVDGRVLHVVAREGVPLLYVFERRSRGTWTELR
jgi:hypothetical protein